MDIAAELACLNPETAQRELLERLLEQTRRDAATIKAANLKIQASRFRR